MPVYNGASFIRAALDSLLAQTFSDFELIISDNASTDGTESICRAYAGKESRIRYVRQPANRGAAFNFSFVLSQASGQYFMWAAHDDSWDKDYISSCISILEINSNVFACTTNVLIDGNALSCSTSGVAPLTGSELQRAIKFLKSPGANSRFYSIYRTYFIKQAFVPYDYLGGDWSNIIDFLKYGEFITIEEYFGFNKTLTGMGSSPNRFSKFRRKNIELILPYYEFSKKTMNDFSHPAILFYLVKQNMLANKQRIKNIVNIIKTLLFDS